MHARRRSLSSSFSTLLDLLAGTKPWQRSGSDPFTSRRETPPCVRSLPRSWSGDDRGNSGAPTTPLAPPHRTSSLEVEEQKGNQTSRELKEPSGVQALRWRECPSLCDIRPFPLPPFRTFRPEKPIHIPRGKDAKEGTWAALTPLTVPWGGGKNKQTWRTPLPKTSIWKLAWGRRPHSAFNEGWDGGFPLGRWVYVCFSPLLFIGCSYGTWPTSLESAQVFVRGLSNIVQESGHNRRKTRGLMFILCKFRLLKNWLCVYKP